MIFFARDEHFHASNCYILISDLHSTNKLHNIHLKDSFERFTVTSLLLFITIISSDLDCCLFPVFLIMLILDKSRVWDFYCYSTAKCQERRRDECRVVPFTNKQLLFSILKPLIRSSHYLYLTLTNCFSWIILQLAWSKAFWGWYWENSAFHIIQGFTESSTMNILG